MICLAASFEVTCQCSMYSFVAGSVAKVEKASSDDMGRAGRLLPYNEGSLTLLVKVLVLNAGE